MKEGSTRLIRMDSQGERTDSRITSLPITGNVQIHDQLTLQQRDKHCGLGGESGSGGLGQPTPGSLRGRRGSWGTLRRLARFGMIRGRGGTEGWRVPTVGPSEVGERENRPGELS